MATMYFVELLHKGGNFFPEQNSAEMDRSTMVRDIATGQHEDVHRVIEVDLDAGTSRDVTREIASEVVMHLEEADDCAFAGLHEFLCTVLNEPLRSIQPAEAA